MKNQHLKHQISIHALRGEGDVKASINSGGIKMISIHALRGEGDRILVRDFSSAFGISIHALRGEGDFRGRGRGARLRNFNPRPPWGGRRLLL